MDENRVFRPLEHPLQNADIMEQVLKNLSVRDLLTSRQVCRVWLEGSAKAMRSRANIKIDCKSNASAMLQFLEVAEATKRIFFKAPDVHRYTLIGPLAYDERFWTFCRRIKSLHLDGVRFPSANAFRHAVFQSFPKLEELHLKNVKVDGDLAQEPLEWVPPQFTPNENLKQLKLQLRCTLKITWMEFISHFPSLQDLDASNVYSNDDTLFRSLALARQHNAQCWDLKKLRIYFRPVHNTREIAELLVQGNFSLEFLGLVGLSNSDSDSIQMILSNQTANLRKLTLGNITPQQNIFPLPNLTILEKLTDLSLDFSALQSTRFLRSMPNLKKLKLSEVEPVFRYDETEEDDWAIYSCTELELDLRNFDVKDLHCLQKRLPNVEKVDLLNCKNEMFNVVCEYWNQITSLELTGGDVDEAGISGLDLEDIKRMTEDINCRPITVRRANLSTLKNLKSITIYNETIKDLWTPSRLFVERFLQVNWDIYEIAHFAIWQR